MRTAGVSDLLVQILKKFKTVEQCAHLYQEVNHTAFHFCSGHVMEGCTELAVISLCG